MHIRLLGHLLFHSRSIAGLNCASLAATILTARKVSAGFRYVRPRPTGGQHLNINPFSFQSKAQMTLYGQSIKRGLIGRFCLEMFCTERITEKAVQLTRYWGICWLLSFLTVYGFDVA